jgi:ketosteroid isomerase-like protein
MWTPDRAVLEANLSFYEAFAAQDFNAMGEVWSERTPISCIHPGWQPLHGRERVMSSWRAVLRHQSAPIRCEDARATVFDDAALVTCVERIASALLAATNFFALEDGLWKMVHHHAAPFSDHRMPEDLGSPRGPLN